MVKKQFQEPYAIKRKPPINIDEIRQNELFIEENYAFNAAYICELENVYVTPYGIVFKGWKLVKESLYSMFTRNNFYGTLIKKRLLNKVKKVKGLSFVGTHAFYDNFYHFTAECLPRLYSLRQYATEGKLLIHERMPKFVTAYLQILGFKSIETIKDDELVLAERLLLPMHTADGHSHNGKLMREMTRWIKNEVKVETYNFSEYKNVYLSRKKAQYRHLLNEPEVEALIKAYGFKTVYLEDFTVPEQIALFSQIRNLIAIHGAGNTNIMYMEEGGLVIEIIHENHLQPCYYNLADAFNLDTIMIQGAGVQENKKDPTVDSLSVDLSRLKYYLDNYLR